MNLPSSDDDAAVRSEGKQRSTRDVRAPEVVPDFVLGELTVRFQTHEVTVGRDVVKLTPVEYRLLYHLVRNAGNVLTHQALLDHVWGDDRQLGPEYVKVFISRLRAKLRTPGSPTYIQTERGVGYRFVKTRSQTTPAGQVGMSGVDTPPGTWLAVDRIDPGPESRTLHRNYSRPRLQQLADSIRELGMLEPVLVIPAGSRFQIIAGNRRLQAAVLAGLTRVPAIVLSDVDEHRQLLVNLVESAQRADLTPAERIGAVGQLAASGLGVREIARATGLSPGTVSRWIRLSGNAVLVRALEDGRIDLFRAMCLAGVTEPLRLGQLIDAAREYSHEDFHAFVQQRPVGIERRDSNVARQLKAMADQLDRLDAVPLEASESLSRIAEISVRLLKRVPARQR